MRRARTSCAAHRSISSSSSAVEPETTTDAGPLTAATDSPCQEASSSRASAAGSATETMPPRPASAMMARLRRATTRAASCSVRAPATAAAAISPCEWPTTAAGWMPWDRHSAAMETLTAHSAGCTTSTRSKPGAPGASRRTSISDQSVNGASALAHSVSRAANTGEVSSSSTAMPYHCAPWPGKTNTARPASSPTLVPSTTCGAEAPSASARSP